jgi:hypothetical protein
MDDQTRTFHSDDGREWSAALEAPGTVMRVPPELENAGGMLPEEAIHIVFRSGEETLREEYTGLTMLEDMSDDDLREWFRAARRGRGL